MGCSDNRGEDAIYVRTPRLFDDIAASRGDGRYHRLLGQLQRVELLVLDDFLLTPATVEQCRDLLEVIEDRTQLRSTLVASQLLVNASHGALADPTVAEGVLDRLLHRAHRLVLTGASLRLREPEDAAKPSRTRRRTAKTALKTALMHQHRQARAHRTAWDAASRRVPFCLTFTDAPKQLDMTSNTYPETVFDVDLLPFTQGSDDRLSLTDCTHENVTAQTALNVSAFVRNHCPLSAGTGVQNHRNVQLGKGDAAVPTAAAKNGVNEHQLVISPHRPMRRLPTICLGTKSALCIALGVGILTVGIGLPQQAGIAAVGLLLLAVLIWGFAIAYLVAAALSASDAIAPRAASAVLDILLSATFAAAAFRFGAQAVTQRWWFLILAALWFALFFPVLANAARR